MYILLLSTHILVYKQIENLFKFVITYHYRLDIVLHLYRR